MRTLIEIIREHIVWRRQIITLARADIVKTYSGAALGWAWAIIKPAVMVLVLWFAFSVGLRVNRDINGCPYILWVLSGMVPWFYMSDMIRQGTNSITRYRYLVTKMKFPVSTITTFVGFSKLIVHFFILGIMIVIFIILGHFPGKYLLQLPIYMAMMIMFFTSLALFTVMLSSVSKDFKNLVQSFITPIFWISGIMYDVNAIDVGWIKKVMLFNPVSYFASGYRNIFIYETWIWEDKTELICFMVMFIATIAAATWVYSRTVKEIPDML